MRKVISLLLLVSFLVLAASGLQMSLGVKPQRTAPPITAGTTMEERSAATPSMPLYPKKAHEWAGFLFIGAGLVHTVLNRRAIAAYLSLNKKV